jgi:hypothetical protein
MDDRLDTLRRSWAYWQEMKALHCDELVHSPVTIEMALVEIKHEADLIKHSKGAVMPLDTLKTRETNGEDLDTLEREVLLLIGGVREGLNVANNITVNQAAEAAIDVVAEFGGLSIEEIALCFNNGRKGDYGELMHRLDGPMLLRWLRQYVNDREQYEVEVNRQFHESAKRFDSDGVNSAIDMGKFLKVLPRGVDPKKDLYKMDKRAEGYFDSK